MVELPIGAIMKEEAEDQSVLNVIQQLAAEEHRLYEHEALTDADRARLTKINIELDQCWDLLRQRQALRDAGRNPDEAHVRPPETDSRRANSSPKFCTVAFQSSTWRRSATSVAPRSRNSSARRRVVLNSLEMDDINR
jgi:Protein of unknown function (DUF2630)